MIQRYLALASVLLVFACSGEKKVAGTDTGNPMIQAMVTDSLGNPLDSAQVIIYTDTASSTVSLSRIASNSATNYPVAIDTVYTDSKGYARFSAVVSSKYSLEVYWKNSLGAFTEVNSTNEGEVEIEARNLIAFPTTEAAILEGTGRYLAAGSTTMIPQGLWKVRFGLIGSDQSYAPLEFRAEDADQLPDLLLSLGVAARMLDSMDVVPEGYVELAMFPVDPEVKGKLLYACAAGQFDHATDCEADNDCRIWQWKSNWVIKQSGAPVLVAAISTKAQIKCLFFPDGLIANGSYFYSYSDVRKGP